MHRYLQIGIVALMAGLGPLACGGEGGASPEVGGATELASNGDPKGDKGDKDKRLDDVQIVTVLHVVNQGEILEARFALKRATREDVRDFAKRMETEHKAADEKLRDLFGDAVPPADPAEDIAASAPESDSPPDKDVPVGSSQISRLFKRQTVLDMQQLRMTAPPDFDLGYITKQVAGHAGVLATIDQHLLPSVQKRELRRLIVEMRPEVATHLAIATGITQTIISETDKGQASAP